MLAQERPIQILTKNHSLRSNEPLFLDDPHTLWQVHSGSVAVFALGRDHTDRQRRYLFNVKSGEVLLPTCPDTQADIQIAPPLQLVAVALEPVELRSHPIHTLTASQLQSWTTRLGYTLASLSQSHSPLPIAQRGLLISEEKFQPGDCWVRLLHGQASLMGIEMLNLDPAMGWVPLSSNLWLQASTTVELETAALASNISTDISIHPAARLKGLAQIQRLVLRGVETLETIESRQEQARFLAREQLNTQSVTDTLQDLAGVFTQPVANPLEELDTDDALLKAVGAVGHALGVTIHPPASSEDLGRVKDPLVAIARASHIRIRSVKLCDRWWQRDSGPLLAYADNNPVALLPINDTRYDFYDPAQGTRTRCTPQLAATLEPTAYTFYRPLPEQPKPWQLAHFALYGRLTELGIILGAGVAVTLLGMVAPQATGILIDQAIPNADRRLLLQLGLGLLVTALGTSLFQLTQSIAIMRLETLADSTTQAAVWDQLLKLKASFFRQYAMGDLSSRVSAVSQIRQKIGNTILKSLFSSVFSFLNLGLLFYYSPTLALIAVGVAILNIAVTLVSGMFTLRKVRPLLEEQGRLFGMVVQLINGVSKFRVAGAETRAYAYWGKQYSHQLRLNLSSQGIEDNLAVINSLLAAITPAVLFSAATYVITQSQASGGSFSTGTFLAFNAAFGTFIGGATSLSTTLLDVLEVVPIWQRAQPILRAVPEVDETKANPGRLTGRISVNNVVFRYRPEGARTLDAVNITAEPGEFIALVGPSGSGKSTLFRLLLGFETPESGTVTFDGQDLAGLDVGAVRRQLGVVLQNSRLMSASIFENIASSAPISMDEAWDAARMAGFAEDVEAMPMGMHTVVSEGGTNLSGGQRQRLLIARALALKPRILLFDEATSALDNRTQAIVSESLDRLKVTRVVVAHRLSTIRNADRIYVLAQGQVVEAGSYEQLVAQEGVFSQLIKRQQV